MTATRFPTSSALPVRGAPGMRMLLVIVAVAAAYFIAGRLLMVLSAPPNGAVATVWLPSGIAVAAMVLFGPWVAVGSFVGSMALDIVMKTPLPAALFVAIANAGSELLCYYLIARRGGREFSTEQVPDGVRLALGAVVAAAVSACVGVTGYVNFGVLPATAYWASWLTWFGSVVVGIVLITPFLACSVRDWRAFGARTQYAEFAAVVTLLAITAFLWQGPAFTRDADEPLILVVVLMMLWVAFRFPPASMALTVFAFAVSAVTGAVLRLQGEPPATAYVSIFALQLMLGGLAMIGYLLAAMVASQKRATHELMRVQDELVAHARRAGMAEIANNVLHNVGNILNSVNTSAGVLTSKVRGSRAQGLARVVQLMQDNAADLGAYLTTDAKGRLVPGYLSQVAEAVTAEQRDMLEELGHLIRSIDHIKNVVATQQSYAGSSTLLELVQIRDVVEDALRITDDSLVRHRIAVDRQFAEVPLSRLDRTRIIQILVNLISNAKHAMAASADGMRRLTLGVEVAGACLRVRVEDEGEGISAENLTRIFTHGFTTRDGGHGFGLHSCALAARDMGGTLTASSGGPGKGASFTLELPLDTPGPIT